MPSGVCGVVFALVCDVWVVVFVLFGGVCRLGCIACCCMLCGCLFGCVCLCVFRLM